MNIHSASFWYFVVTVPFSAFRAPRSVFRLPCFAFVLRNARAGAIFYPHHKMSKHFQNGPAISLWENLRKNRPIIAYLFFFFFSQEGNLFIGTCCLCFMQWGSVGLPVCCLGRNKQFTHSKPPFFIPHTHWDRSRIDSMCRLYFLCSSSLTSFFAFNNLVS